MSEKIFKGFKQVKSSAFEEAKLKNELTGYLWFVRTEVVDDNGVNDATNDEYDIYFGSKHYGHFCASEMPAIEARLTAIEELHEREISEILATLSGMTDTISGHTDVITGIQETIKGFKIKDLVENDNFLKLTNGVLSSDMDITYQNGWIKLKDKNGNVITDSGFDASEFVKDGFLKKVEIVEATTASPITYKGVEYKDGTKFIEFVWNTDIDPDTEGEQNKVYIRVDEIGKIYEGDGTSIEISSENKISVKAVSGEKVNLNEIPVGGTPLADILTANGINTINAGNLQSVLEALFSNEEWPANPVRNIPTSASASQAVPTITFSKTLAKVGERITVNASAKTASGSATVSYSGFTYGYSADNDNTRDSESNPPSVSKNIVRTSGNYGLSASITSGFTSQTIPTSAITTSATAASLASTYLIPVKGSNKVKVETTTPTFSITIPKEDMPEYYACSTLKKTSNEHKVLAATANTTYTGLTASNSAESAMTAVYPIYVNATWAVDPVTNNAGDGQSNANTAYGKTGTTSANFSEKLTSLTNGSTTFYAFIAFGNGGFTIKLPTGWIIESAQTKSDTKTGTYDGNQGIPTKVVTNTEVVAAIKDGETVVVPATTLDYNVYNFNIVASNVIRLKIKVG